MKNIIVCDDSIPFMKVMIKLLDKYADLYELTIVGFSNGSELLEHCRNNPVDIIYMDIEVGEENGMMLAKAIKTFNPNVIVIYMSSYDSYYVDMVNAEPFRFIRKDATDIPKLELEVADALEAAVQRINGKDIFSFIFDRMQYSIELSRVKYFRSVARTIHIIGDVGKPDYYYGKIDDLQKELERINGNFIRINKSCIVNMKYAILSGKNKVVIDGKSLSITPKYIDGFTERHNGYWLI